MARENTTVIPFDKNITYEDWRNKFMFLLRFKKCLPVVQYEIRPEVIKEADWEEQENKVMYFLSLALNAATMADLETPKQILDKLDSIYLKKSESKQLLIERQLNLMKLNENASKSQTEKFFEDFDKKINELRLAGGDISRKRKLSFLIMALPKDCRHLVDDLDSLAEQNRTTEYIREKLMSWNELSGIQETESTTEDKELKSQAFNTKLTKGRNWHKTNENPKTCWNCGKVGHMKQNCYQNGRGHGQNSRGSYNGQGYRGFYQAGGRNNYNKGRGNYGRRFAGNSEVQNMQEDEGNLELFHVDVNSFDLEQGKNTNVMEWLIDSGCTDHITKTDEYFYSSVDLKTKTEVKLGNSDVIKATKIGNIMCRFRSGDKNITVDIKNVYYVPEIGRNLLSVSSIMSTNKTVIFSGKYAEIYNEKNEFLFHSKQNKKLFSITCEVLKGADAISANHIAKNMSTKERFHRILGHVNFKDLNIMCRDKYLDDLPDHLDNNFISCKICLESKMSNKEYASERRRARYCGEIVHSDVKYLDVDGFNGEKYFVTFIEDYSRIARAYPIKNKSEVYDKFVEYFNILKNYAEGPLCEFRCDNGKEFLNKEFYNLAKNEGFRIFPCIAYNHQLNGVAERYNRTIMDRVRCLRKESKLDRKYWPEFVLAACFVGNRLRNSSTFESKTPFEIFFGRKPSAKNLKIYGSRVYVRIPDEKRKTSDDKAVEGILIGYTDLGYRVLINGKIELARNVQVVEPGTDFIQISDDEENDDNEIEKDNNEGSTIDRPVRKRRLPNKYDDFIISVNLADLDAPKSFDEAINSVDSQNWKDAMIKEFSALNDSKTWELIPKPVDKKILSVKWVYKKKSEDNFKARLVVRGYEQKDQIDEIYAPVAKMSTLRLLLSLSVKRGFNVHHMDVETAFLNSDVKSEVYVSQPDGFIKNENMVYHLKKSLYGLRESPRNWYDHFNNFITKLGFTRSNHDLCLYCNVKSEIYCILFVDDLLICGPDKELIESIKSEFKIQFKMKDLGNVKRYLGIEIDFNKSTREMKLSQEEYIETLAEKFGIVHSRIKHTPMETGLKLFEGKINESLNYRNLIGALSYIAQATRPDIMYAINYLSRFQNCCSDTHYKHAIRILIYLYHSKHLSLHFTGDSDIMICGYSDSDWAGDPTDSKSTTGSIIKVFGNPIFWKTVKQKSVSRSSTQAEYIALAYTIEEILFIKNILVDLGLSKDLLNEIKIYVDNISCIMLAKNGNFSKRSKHINVALHFVHDTVNNKLIDVVKIDGNVNLADTFTKSLCRDKFENYRYKMNVY